MELLRSKLKYIENIGISILKYVFSALLGYIFSKASIKTYLSPFSLSFLSVIPETKFSGISFYLGSCIGFLTKDFSPYNFKYIIANTVMFVVILIIGNKQLYKRAYSPIIPSVICLVTGLPFLFIDRFLTLNLLLLTAESILCGCISYFLRYLLTSIKNRVRFDSKDYISLNITVIVCLCAIDGYFLFGTSLLYVAVILLCYLSAHFFDIKTVLFFNLTVCAVPALLHPQNLNSFILLYLPSVIASLIARYSIKHIVSAYFLSYISVYIIFFDFSNLPLIAAPVYSAAIFLLLPKNRINDITSIYFKVKQKISKQSNDLSDICKKLNLSLADTIVSLERTTQTINDDDSVNKIKRFLHNNRCKNVDVIFFYDETGKCIISVSCKTEAMFSFEALKNKIEDITKEKYVIYNSSQDGTSIYCKFKQQDIYKIDCYAIYKPKNGETVCGDSVVAFKSSNGYYNMIIADGMGSGKDAFSKSNNTVMIFKKLFKYNVDCETVIETVNSSFDFINDEIGFSTVDLCRVSLNDASAEFIKCGAYKSYILRNQQLTTIASGGFPLGLDKKACFIQKDISLQDDDIIIMLSDGVVAADESVQSAILLSKSTNSENIARELVDIAYKNTPKDLDDDMTVMVAKVTKILT